MLNKDDKDWTLPYISPVKYWTMLQVAIYTNSRICFEYLSCNRILISSFQLKGYSSNAIDMQLNSIESFHEKADWKKHTKVFKEKE